MPGEQVYVVPRAAVVGDAGWYGIRTDWPRGVRGRRRGSRSVCAPRPDGGRPRVQAGDPVSRPARRRPVLPDAADDGGGRRSPPRSLLDRGRWSSQPRRRRAARRSSPRMVGGARRRFHARIPAGGAAQRRHDGGGRRPPRCGLSRRRRRPPGGDPRDRQADRCVRGAGRRRRRRRSARDLEPTRLRLPDGRRVGCADRCVAPIRRWTRRDL